MCTVATFVSTELAILNESEAGAATPELCRKYGIAQNTFLPLWRYKPGAIARVADRRYANCGSEATILGKLFRQTMLQPNSQPAAGRLFPCPQFGNTVLWHLRIIARRTLREFYDRPV